MNQPADEVKKILLVDSEQSTLKSTRKVIEDRCEYSVHAISDPKKVIDILEWNDIDLVISDLDLPRLDGAEVARMVRD